MVTFLVCLLRIISLVKRVFHPTQPHSPVGCYDALAILRLPFSFGARPIF